MPLASTDLLLKYSIASGAAGNAAAGTAAGSLGKYITTTQVPAGANGIFDDISAAENAASTVDYRCIFVHNAHASITAFNVAVFLSAEVAGGASIALAVDSIAASALASASAQSATIANETTAPSGVGAFSSPTTAGAGLSLGNLTPGQVKAFWVRRTAANTAAVDADGFTVGVYAE
jgi:hypothetical protein